MATSTFAILPSTRAVADQPIGVQVNGNPVNFTGAPPVEVNGSVLVPLRGVFEAMGAGVNYDSTVHTITAKKGSEVVIRYRIYHGVGQRSVAGAQPAGARR